MPNIVFNRLVVSGPPSELAAFVERVRDPCDDEEDPRVLDFRQHVPIPPDLELRETVEPDDHAGLPPWYWWATENWGTKWNALGTEIEGDPTTGHVLYKFETAWSTPDPWVFVVSAAHPALTFEHEFAEEFEQFAGRARLRGGELERFKLLEAADLDWVEFEEFD
jgi:hypothetical protein